MKYGFTALAINEFSGLTIACTPEQSCTPGFSGDAVLTNLGFDSKGSLQLVRWGLGRGSPILDLLSGRLEHVHYRCPSCQATGGGGHFHTNPHDSAV